MTLNEYVDKVYIVSVSDAIERHEHCIEQMSKHNIEFEFSLTERQKKGRSKLSKGEYGCHLGHKKALLSSKSNKFNRVCIFEDDVVLCEDFNERFDRFINELDNRKFNALALGYDIQNNKTEHNILSRKLLKLKHCWAGQSYILTDKSVQYLISLYNKKILIPDWYLSLHLVFGYGIYAPYPALTKQALFDSILLDKCPLEGYVRNGRSTWVNIINSYSDYDSE